MATKVSAVPILARRFLLSKASDGFLSFISWVSVLGVAVGVLALVVVTSVINGFEGELVHLITGMNGDVILYTRGDPVRDPAAIERKIRRVLGEHVEAVSPGFITQLMILGPSGPAGIVLEGVNPKTIGTVTSIPRRVISGRMPENDGEVALTSALADRIGATEGSEVRMTIPYTGDDEGTSGAKVVRTKVVGIVKMGMYEYDSKFVFATLPYVQRFLGQPGRVTAFKLKLAPGADSRDASDRLSDSFGYPFRAKDWGQLNQNILYAIKLEKAVIAIILTVIVVVAAFNVVSTLMMMIHDKSREIAILKAMGFRRRQSFGLFCLIGVWIGAAGTLIGTLVGLGLGWVLKETRLIHIPADIYYIGFLPVVVRWHEVAWIALVAMVISFLATLYPSIQVSRRPPLEGLRYE